VVLAQAGQLGPLETRFVELIDVERIGLPFAVAALAVAFGVGALHALAPGHGKAIAAAYLVGVRGRARDALALGGIVAVMHSLSVLALGLALFGFTQVRVERLRDLAALASALLVLAVGVGLTTRYARRPRRHAHVHLPEGVSPLSRRGLVLLGLSGGLLPSPSAFLVLSTALFAGRAGFGLALVAAFSLGLAATLSLVGLAVLRGRDVVQRRVPRSPRLARLAAAAPRVSALAVLVGGLWLTAAAVLRLW
jgi:nickel/cobalt exporter